MNQPIQIATPGAPPQAVEIGQSDASSAINDLAQLTKARLTSMVLVSTSVGFCMASEGNLNWAKLVNTLIGTGLVAGAAAVLNQVMETDADRLMERTKARPLPAGRVTRSAATLLGVAMACAGLACLAVATTFVAAYLATATLGVYLAIYTPMKRRSSLCVPLGAVSGAIPPLIGWTAVNGSFGLGAWVLFGVLFAWQIPHFLAIAWMYRDDYSRAGFRMLREGDITGLGTAVEALLFSLGLTAITLAPVLAHTAGSVYFVGALAADLLLTGCAACFLLERSRRVARRLFFVSILYLPLLLGLMVLTKGTQ